MQHARTSGQGSDVQAWNITFFTISEEACRQPANACIARMRSLAAMAVRRVNTYGVISGTKAVEAGERYPACTIGEPALENPLGGTGMVGRPGTIGAGGVG